MWCFESRTISHVTQCVYSSRLTSRLGDSDGLSRYLPGRYGGGSDRVTRLPFLALSTRSAVPEVSFGNFVWIVRRQPSSQTPSRSPVRRSHRRYSIEKKPFDRETSLLGVTASGF